MASPAFVDTRIPSSSALAASPRGPECVFIVAFDSALVLAKVHSLAFLQTLTAVCPMPRLRWRLEAEELPGRRAISDALRTV